jgi:hypothetical protein
MAIKVANNQSLTAITVLPSAVSGGAMTLLETQTASSSATLSFTSDIDDTYDEYVFRFYNIHPATDNAEFTVNFRDGSTAYDATKTTTYVNTYHDEADSGTGVGYNTGQDLAQSTGFQTLAEDVGADNDQNIGGYLHLFSPSNTTFVKNFISRMCVTHGGDYIQDVYVAGYSNHTAALDGVQFKFSTGNIDSGVIKLYGIS